MTLLKFRPETGRVTGPRYSNLLENFLESDFPAFFQNEFSKLASPAVNIKETKDAYNIEASVPGFAKDSFNIKVEDNLLTISAEVKEEKAEDGENYTRKEFTHASFKRSFTLPKTIVADKISAAYENGIL